VMSDYLAALEFTDLDLDMALRKMLQSFRIPGEAQKIERILEKFASHYYQLNPIQITDSITKTSVPLFSSSDGAWALSYAIIMLNTDAHNQTVKKKMTKSQFLHNCRGINDEKDFPRIYLENMYERIVLDEIRIHSLSSPVLYPDARKKGFMTLMITTTTGGSGSTRVTRTTTKPKKYWFILENQSLIYFKKAPLLNLATQSGVIDLKNARLVVRSNIQTELYPNSPMSSSSTNIHADQSLYAFTIELFDSSSSSFLSGSDNSGVYLQKDSPTVPLRLKSNLKKESLIGGSSMQSYDFTLSCTVDHQLWTKNIKKAIDMPPLPVIETQIRKLVKEGSNRSLSSSQSDVALGDSLDSSSSNPNTPTSLTPNSTPTPTPVESSIENQSGLGLFK